MMIRTAILAAFIGTVRANETCFDYSQVLNLELSTCTAKTLSRQIRDAFNAVRNGQKCKGGLKREIRALTRASTDAAAQQTLQDLCDSALADATDEAKSKTKDWQFLKTSPSNIDLEKFFEGDGFLNIETGNFQQDENDFIKRGGYERFLYVGEDPRLNDHYPTTDNSFVAGEAVYKFYNDEAQKSFLTAPTVGFENNCQSSNTVMCCWHRDRQYLDRNGNCGFADCSDQNPGDNTDLCWTEDDTQTLFPYPGDVTEKDLHCHGFAWGNDHGVNTNAKWNNLFFVSLYDHMYQRGYVESITNDVNIAGNQAMCGCVEEMAPVARADCTEAVGTTTYTTSIDSDGLLVIEHVPNAFKIEFEPCNGYDFVEDFTPKDYTNNPNAAELKASKNDLSAFVFRQYLEGKMTTENVATVEDTIVGYRSPEVNKSDKAREEVCAKAFADRFPGQPYTERDRTSETEVTV